MTPTEYQKKLWAVLNIESGIIDHSTLSWTRTEAVESYLKPFGQNRAMIEARRNKDWKAVKVILDLA